MILAGIIILCALLAVVGARLYVIRKEREFEKTHQDARELFGQTAEALASAIDAKDSYTNGHSRRVAEYSRKIAEEAGKSEEECERVYFAALLHDVGKIGVPIEILTKKGRLTEEEFEQIKLHPVMGGQILSSIRQSPWLSIGARYHHERCDGRGYPEGLKGTDIPEIARIIAVADAYDAMTSNRSYRKAIPQHIVREEMVKCIGTQFDPEFAKIMIHLIDLDTEYRMQEMEAGTNVSTRDSIRCESIYNDCTEGVAVTKKPAHIRFCSQPDDGVPADRTLPSLILFDSLDGKVHPGEEKNPNLLYFEYARIRMDGQIVEGGTRKVEVTRGHMSADSEISGYHREKETGQYYEVSAVRYKDHALVRILSGDQTIQVILALPDSTRFLYVSVGGEKCFIHNIMVENEETEIGEDTIPRIAEEISFIKGCPQGDVPNIQVDGWRTEASEGIPVTDHMALSFHTMSLPTARLVWHCAFISVFSAADGRVNGRDFREYILLRLDGENWGSDEHVENNVVVEKRPDFVGWDEWKERNRQGLDCVVTIRREKNQITMQTENLGISIHSTTTILDNVQNVYVALTGDQCAITDIRCS